MGIFSWFSSTASKTKAAVIIQQAFENYKNAHLIDGDPAKLANHVVEIACAQAPGLESEYNDHMLAIACLTVVLTDTRISQDLHFACIQSLQRFHIFLSRGIEVGQIRLSKSQNSLMTKSLAVLSAFDNSNPNIQMDQFGISSDDAAVDIDNFGRSSERRVIQIDAKSSFDSAAMEFDYIASVLGINSQWSILSQSMVQEGHLIYDKAEVLLQDGSTKSFWFDITKSYRNWERLDAATATSPTLPTPKDRDRAMEEMIKRMK